MTGKKIIKVPFEKVKRNGEFYACPEGQRTKFLKLSAEYQIKFSENIFIPSNCVCLSLGDLYFFNYEDIVEIKEEEIPEAEIE